MLRKIINYGGDYLYFYPESYLRQRPSRTPSKLEESGQ